MTTWELIKKSWDKRDERRQREEQLRNPLDKDVPLGLHIDGKIILSPVSLVLGPAETELRFPAGIDREQIVQAIGVAKLYDRKWFRILLHPADNDGESSYLLILQGEKPDDLLMRWFVKHDEVFPAADEWEFWLDQKEGMIGYPLFELKDKTQYPRLWVGESDKHIDPVVLTERVLLDRYDDAKQITLGHTCMLYGRSVTTKSKQKTDELVFISAVREGKGSHVTVDIGVDVNHLSELKVVY